MSPDPLAVHAFGSDPNPYAYVRGRVLSSVDPFGLDDDPPPPTAFTIDPDGTYRYPDDPLTGSRSEAQGASAEQQQGDDFAGPSPDVGFPVGPAISVPDQPAIPPIPPDQCTAGRCHTSYSLTPGLSAGQAARLVGEKSFEFVLEGAVSVLGPENTANAVTENGGHLAVNSVTPTQALGGIVVVAVVGKVGSSLVGRFAVDAAAEGAGAVASNAANAPRLAMQLATQEAESAFTATGELSQEAIQGARQIIPPGQLGNPAIPQGFGKFSTGTFQSPSGPFPGPLLHEPILGRDLLWARFQGDFQRRERADVLPALRRERTMKVRCIKLLDSRGQPVERSAWAKLGSVYHVLSVWVEAGKASLRLVGEEPTPALFEPEMFEVVTSAIPPTWVVTSPKPGCLSFEPAAWSGAGFWERFFDAEPEAIAAFKEERAKIIAADP